MSFEKVRDAELIAAAQWSRALNVRKGGRKEVVDMVVSRYHATFGIYFLWLGGLGT